MKKIFNLFISSFLICTTVQTAYALPYHSGINPVLFVHGTNKIIKPQMDTPTVSQIVNDTDWIVVATNQSAIINDIVSSRINISTLNLTSISTFYAAMGYDTAKMNATIAQTKAAAQRLVDRYNLSSYTCSSCNVDASTKVVTLKSMLSSFRSDATLYSRFQAATTGGCGWWFYVCAGLCGLTCETPACLICLAYCWHSECQ